MDRATRTTCLNPMLPGSMHIRAVQLSGDSAAVFALNEQLFAESWSAEAIQNALSSESYACYVCSDGGEILGYVLSQHIIDEIHIMQIAVAEDYQRQGIARALMLHVLQQYQQQMRQVLLEVRASNSAAQQFYTSLGFHVTGRRKQYYVPLAGCDRREDAVLMTLML